MVDVILAMAGEGNRSGLKINKVLYPINGIELFIYSVHAFLKVPNLKDLILVINKRDEADIERILRRHQLLDKVLIVCGGKTRAESVRKGLEVSTSEKILIHDAARPLITYDDIMRVVSALDHQRAVTLVNPVYDTLKEVAINKVIKTLPREAVKRVITPQGIKSDLKDYLLYPELSDDKITDEMVILENVVSVYTLETANQSIKVTTQADLKVLSYYLKLPQGGMLMYRIGHSYDFHPLTKNRPLILGGITIPFDQGLAGHSDADAALHVVAESIIGALGLGDLGTHFPDNDPAYFNRSSSYFVEKSMKLAKEAGYVVNNIDLLIYIEKPSLKEYKSLMASNIAGLLEITKDLVNVKATTMEKFGIIGEELGIAAEAVVLLRKDK